MDKYNPWLASKHIDEEAARAFNRFGATLRKLGIVDVLYMDWDEEEDISPGCGCGGCYVTLISAGVLVVVGEAYEEHTVCHEWY